MIKSFECFRLIGTILVFICHITLFDLSIGGGVPVEMFFVLSGFGMMLGYGNDSIKFIPYMKKRLNRLYPLYFISLIFGALYMIFVLDLDMWHTIIKAPVFILCLQTLTPYTSATGFNSPAWYVATLLWIYLFFYWFSKANQFKWGGDFCMR